MSPEPERTPPARARPRRHLGRAGALALMTCLLHACDGPGHLNDLLMHMESDAPSRSEGKASRGALVEGKRLPSAGANFTSYSSLGSLIGRTHTHSRVRDTMLDAYASLEATHPDVSFVFAETGWPRGGAFAPHRTHQNGLSVDFVVPTVDADGAPAKLSCWPWNTWCYGLDFDASGRLGDRRIDFAALAAHLLALDHASRQNGLRVKRVILDPRLRPELFSAPGGASVRRRLRFMKRRAWVRHDDHYHVDFATP